MKRIANTGLTVNLMILAMTIGAFAQRPFQAGDRVEWCIDRVYQPNNCKNGTVIALGDGYFVKVQIDGEKVSDARFYNEDSLRKIGGTTNKSKPSTPKTQPKNEDNKPVENIVDSIGGLFKKKPKTESSTDKGDCVKVDYHQDGKKILLAKVISVKAEEPRYKVRYLSSHSFETEGFAYSKQVKSAPCGEDEYDSDWLIGPWAVVQGVTQNVSAPRYNSDGSATVWTETTLSSFGGNLGINANGTYIWKQDDGTVIKGKWAKSSDKNYSLVLKKARHGKDWNVWSTGKDAKKRKTMRIQTVGGGVSMYGFQSGK